MNATDLIIGIVCVSIAVWIFWSIGLFSVPFHWQTANSFCIEHGYIGVAGGQIGDTLRCAARGYEPDIPISCKHDSVTNEYYCEMRSWAIKNCWECQKNKKGEVKSE